VLPSRPSPIGTSAHFDRRANQRPPLTEGTGKSSVAIPLARKLSAAYVRIDTIEQALVSSGEIGAAPTAVGYLTGYALAGDQLRVGLLVVAECVNPLKVTRDAWQRVATQHNCWILEAELVCSDQSEHQRRVEHRTTDIPKLILPTWRQVVARTYKPWDRQHLVIDTATSSIADTVAHIHQRVRAMSPHSR
jgi:predicted kinase